VWPVLPQRTLYGIERYAGNRRMRCQIQVCGILDRKPFIFQSIDCLTSIQLIVLEVKRQCPSTTINGCEDDTGGARKNLCLYGTFTESSPSRIESPAEGAHALWGLGMGAGVES